jgi:outer membrane protein assembly factor BamE (lipoprotein component of BamABCDE complex)
MRMSIRLLILPLFLLAAGCSWAPSWFVYKIDINQGNFVTQDGVDKLRVGQSKSQVRLLLGTPLVADAFHANRWDYIYRFESGGRVRDEHRLTVLFDDEKLVKWSNDPLPVSPIRGYSGESTDGVVRAVAPDEGGFWGTIRGWFGW